MLDRFAKSLEVTKVYPGILSPKKETSASYIGTASKVRIYIENVIDLFYVTSSY